MELEEGSLVLGIVEKIENMNAFVRLENGEVGTIVPSEISPGRIKNLREFVSPNKIVVCQVLRMGKGRIDLSLRRVNVKERKEMMNKHKQKKDLEMGFKSILKDDFLKIQEKILEDFGSLVEFSEECNKDLKLIEKYIPKDAIEKIKKLTEKKKKEVVVKKILKLKCLESEGVEKIRKILENDNSEIKITYISAGNYLISVKAEDYKKANKTMDLFLQEIESKSKKFSCDFSFSDKK